MDDLPVIEFAFPGPLRNRLVDAIRSGIKTTTSSLLCEYEKDGEPLPVAGDRGAVVDSDGRRVAVIQTTAVQVVRLSDVSLEHALAEGEGYGSVLEWRAGHLAFWNSPAMHAELGDGLIVTNSTLIVLEQFALIR